MVASNIMPKVSIVIPTYNTGRYVLDAIDSVLQQTYPNVELIVVDDGSSDDTPALLAQHPGNFIRFRQANAGQSAAMNFGWQQSSGDLLGYLSADDRLNPRAVEVIVAAMAKAPEAVLAYPDFCVIDEDSKHVRTVQTPDYDERLLIANFQCLPGPGALFRRPAWEKVGGWNTGLRNIPDMDFFLRLCQYGPFTRVAEPLADFRIHSGSTTYNPCNAERSDEPLRVINSLYQTSGLSPSILGWKRKAIANAHMLSGFMHGFSGRYAMFVIRMGKAALLDPPSIISRKMVSYVLTILRPKSKA
ncbi:glycosyltransferase [Pseudomonas putida]|uniref:glycosyltransferase n=1 Tax=Pseudomonas putida TaxID=303 RepID=UPI001E43FC80|nr:glycosyltransferase [Pseudomonas putida]MCC9006908.1 glycosyltransferase [Pseudomonas putida]MCI1037349.1 glycosyltransferase [Pseudomonas putida]